MEWISNARYNEEANKGRIYNLKGIEGITIHKYHGCGDVYFLTCKKLGIECVELNTEEFEIAVNNSKKIIKAKVKEMMDKYNKFYESKEENEIVKY